jgi:hypothetical protein
MQREGASIAEDEVDRAARAVQELVVRVAMWFVSVARTVRPSVHVSSLAAQLRLDPGQVRQGAAVSVELNVHAATIRGAEPTSSTGSSFMSALRARPALPGWRQALQTVAYELFIHDAWKVDAWPNLNHAVARA